MPKWYGLQGLIIIIISSQSADSLAGWITGYHQPPPLQLLPGLLAH
jgi:hypothetical protein